MGSEVFAHEAPLCPAIFPPVPDCKHLLVLGLLFIWNSLSAEEECPWSQTEAEKERASASFPCGPQYSSPPNTPEVLRGAGCLKVPSVVDTLQEPNLPPLLGLEPCLLLAFSTSALPRCHWCCCPSAEITAAPKLAVSPTSETGGVRVVFKMSWVAIHPDWKVLLQGAMVDEIGFYEPWSLVPSFLCVKTCSNLETIL